MSPTQRTIRALRDQGIKCAIVEKWNSHVNKRQDLFQIIDVIGLDPEKGVLGIQCCAGSGFSKHVEKLTVERAQETSDWLSTPGTSLYIWGWRKLLKKRGGKAMIWQARVQEITLEDL